MTHGIPPDFEVANAGSSEQFWIETDYTDHLKLWAKRFYPTSASQEDQATNEIQPKSCTIFVHGFVEYVDRYRNVFRLWPSKGHEIVGFDQRGWGETMNATANPVKSYGNTTWPQQFQDLETVIRHTRKRLDAKWGANAVPIFLLGHSMGGGIVTAFNTRSPAWIQQNGGKGPSQEAKDMVAGVVACAPWLILTKPPPWFVVWGATKLLSLVPEMPWSVDLIGKNISRDPVVAHNFENDSFQTKKVYLKAIQGPLQGGIDIVNNAYKQWPESKPLLVLHGTADLVTSHKGSETFVERVQAKDKTLKLFDGYYHDLLNEPGEDKVVVAEYVIDWISSRL
ncbi:alpha/beta-hydrolase [Testicularia cyperi]|uniref:Alpha/beta-hydrolase n=1 Tax=Testicularia cyperi TaxID=1882483 RepID=A0A317Y070_9BASI|nr:alpha/beta-hydrolase [Testicularia cyperi]